MALYLLRPNGDGTVTGWTSEASAPIFDSVDDYTGGAHDSDTTFIAGPNNADSSAFLDLESAGAGFDPTQITLVQVKIAYRKESAGVSGTADTIALSVGMVQSDESTTLTDLVSVDTNAGTTYAETTVTLTNPSTGASAATWNAGRLRIFQDYTAQGCADTTTKLRVTAVELRITTMVPVGQVTETDLAQPITAVQSAVPVGERLGVQIVKASSRAARWRRLGRATRIQPLIRSGKVIAATGSHQVAVGQVVETDLAQAVTARKTQAVGQASETDTAQTVTSRKTGALGQAAETDLAQPLSHAKRIATGQATETDTAQPVAWAPKRRLVGQTAETNEAQAVTRALAAQGVAYGRRIVISAAVGRAARWRRRSIRPQSLITSGAVVASSIFATVGQASETDTAQPIAVNPRRRLVNQTAETDTPQALTARKTRTTGQIAESDAAQPITAHKTRAVAQTVETDAAQPLTAHKTRAVGQVSEVDTAQPLAHRKAKLVGQVVETDEAQIVTATGAKTIAIGQPSETDTPQALTVSPQRRLLGQTAETDEAHAAAAHKTRTVAQTPETDTAQPVTSRKTHAVTQSTQTNAAQPLTHAKRITIAQATEADSGQGVRSLKYRQVAQAGETDASTGVLRLKRLTLGQALEASEAQAARIVHRHTVGPVDEADTARPVAAFGGAALIVLPGRVAPHSQAATVAPRALTGLTNPSES